VTWVLRRSEVWVDNRLRRLNRAILPERGRAIDMIDAEKSHLSKVTPKQPVRARSSGRRMLKRRIGTQPYGGNDVTTCMGDTKPSRGYFKLRQTEREILH